FPCATECIHDHSRLSLRIRICDNKLHRLLGIKIKHSDFPISREEKFNLFVHKHVSQTRLKLWAHTIFFINVNYRKKFISNLGKKVDCFMQRIWKSSKSGLHVLMKITGLINFILPKDHNNFLSNFWFLFGLIVVSCLKTDYNKIRFCQSKKICYTRI